MNRPPSTNKHALEQMNPTPEQLELLCESSDDDVPTPEQFEFMCQGLRNEAMFNIATQLKYVEGRD